MTWSTKSKATLSPLAARRQGSWKIRSRPLRSGTAKQTTERMPNFEQGDIVRVPFPYTDRTTRQRRPALVVSSGPIGRDRTLLWVAMITSAENEPWPDDVIVSTRPEQSGLNAPSVIRPCKLATIEAAHCEALGKVEGRVIEQVLGIVHTLLK